MTAASTTAGTGIVGDSGHAYARTVGDRCQKRQCWGWRCDHLVLANWRNSQGGDD